MKRSKRYLTGVKFSQIWVFSTVNDHQNVTWIRFDSFVIWCFNTLPFYSWSCSFVPCFFHRSLLHFSFHFEFPVLFFLYLYLCFSTLLQVFFYFILSLSLSFCLSCLYVCLSPSLSFSFPPSLLIIHFLILLKNSLLHYCHSLFQLVLIRSLNWHFPLSLLKWMTDRWH